jgi:hypothetical protein
MHAEREKEQNKLEDGYDERAGLQTNTPRTGELRLAWRANRIRPRTGNKTVSAVV